MTPKARRRLLAFSLIWLALGLIGFAAFAGFYTPIVFEAVIVLPAIPLYLLSTRFGTSHASSGWLWVAVHGPPFLNVPGMVVVYVVPALLILGWLAVRRHDGGAIRILGACVAFVIGLFSLWFLQVLAKVR
jgi:hypothetical protein